MPIRSAISRAALFAPALAALALAPAAVASAGSASTGGSFDAPTPVTGTFACVADCAGIDRVRTGSLVRLRGRNLDNADRVVFLGRRGRGDDRVASVTRKSARMLEVRVPAGARSGRLRAIDPAGQKSAPTRGALRMSAKAPALEARVSGRRVYFDSRSATLRWFVGGRAPVDVAIELARPGEPAALARWDHPAALPGSVSRLAWDGLIAGVPVPEGSYEFRVSATPARGEAHAAQSPARVAVAPFVYLRHRFPILGAHDYGEHGAKFGASRGGRAHEGQDVFARCGTPLVAARGGTVKFVATHSRAGNYIVIDGEDTDVDYAYMHLRAPAKFEKGDRVRTGQQIGEVGDTGAASGCHLHFEMWSGPGWYTGGSAIDPLPHLLEWDRAGA